MRRPGKILGWMRTDVARQRLARFASRARDVDGKPGLLTAVRALRRRLPGDRSYGDPLSVAGDAPAQQLGRRLSAVTAQRPSALREAGLGALQVWQALAESQGRTGRGGGGGGGQGDREMAILFTDLVGFSEWSLEAGDEAAVELLRRVGLAIEPVVTRGGGRVVKRIGDGMMAVFDSPVTAVAAAHDACAAVAEINLSGYHPSLRAGVHLGRPRALGGDLFGVDVNVAARVADAARANEVLVSGPVRERLDDDASLTHRRRWRFKAKGAPRDLDVYTSVRVDG